MDWTLIAPRKSRDELIAMLYESARNALSSARYYAELRSRSEALGRFPSRSSELECLDRVRNYRRSIRALRAGMPA